IAVEERRELLRPDPGLRLLAAQVDLDERGDRKLRGRRLGVERVAELADRVDDLRLATLQMADEVPAEGVAVARVLRLEILRAVLTDDLDSRFRERAELVDRHVLRRDDDRDSGPDFL